MTEETTKQQEPVTPDPKETEAPAAEAAETASDTAAEAVQEPAPQPEPDPLAEAQAALEKEHDNYLRLAASMITTVNAPRRKRTICSGMAKQAPLKKFLPVYDNLCRALEQETADAAYKKGVEMIHDRSGGDPEKDGGHRLRRAGRYLRPQPPQCSDAYRRRQL